MIIVNLKGGTGNQLFQYALGRHLSLKNNDVLKLDVSGLDRANKLGDIYRPLQLNAFNVGKEVASDEEVRRLKYPFGIISKGWRWFSFRVLRRTNVIFDPRVLSLTGDIYLDGYWQSPRYFDAIRDVLLKELTLAKPFCAPAAILAAQIKAGPSASIHVRRGDYVKNPRVLKEFVPCSQAYYERAVAEVRRRAGDVTFFVFSDDIGWAKENLPLGERAVYVKDQAITDTEELMLMSLCEHNIIANSSFSWWGAWLNQNPNKVVIAPRPWFDFQPTDPHLIPESWIQLPKV
jgi:hypothetical protein